MKLRWVCSCNGGSGLPCVAHWEPLGVQEIPSLPGPHSHLLLQVFSDEISSSLLCFLNCTRGRRQYLPLCWNSFPDTVPPGAPGGPRLVALPSCPCSFAPQVASRCTASACFCPAQVSFAALLGPLSFRLSLLISPNCLKRSNVYRGRRCQDSTIFSLGRLY